MQLVLNLVVEIAGFTCMQRLYPPYIHTSPIFIHKEWRSGQNSWEMINGFKQFIWQWLKFLDNQLLNVDPGMLMVPLKRLRSSRRAVSVLVIWTCLCYALFQFSSNSESNAYVGTNVNTRLLLQKVTETPVSTTPATAVGAAAPVSDAVTSVQRVDPANSNLNDEELTPMIARRIPNVPFEFWLKEKSKIYGKNHTCAFYPNVFDIKFNNNYWQTFRTSNGTFYLYGAYYDNRAAVSSPTIRILGMIDRIEPKVKTHCLFWFDASKDPVVTPVIEYKYIWSKKWGNYKQGVLQPYLISCLLPTQGTHRNKVLLYSTYIYLHIYHAHYFCIKETIYLSQLRYWFFLVFQRNTLCLN